ncbi:MAG TPA: response regulator [Candidatus Acidoferrales bacterium]|nr:response regulator [Candidatus Acidoferrales bacterium]
MAKILLIEDDNLTRITIGRFLRGEGYEVEEAEDGAKALALLESERFDLIVSDIVLPKASGFAVLDHATAASPSTPVIFVTAYSAMQSQAATRPVRVILKPILLDDLLSAVQSALGQQP